MIWESLSTQTRTKFMRMDETAEGVKRKEQLIQGGIPGDPRIASYRVLIIICQYICVCAHMWGIYICICVYTYNIYIIFVRLRKIHKAEKKRKWIVESHCLDYLC